MNAPERLKLLHERAEALASDGKLVTGGSDFPEPLFDCLLNDPCDIVRHEAAFVIGDVHRQRRWRNSIPALVCLCQATKDESILVRHEVALALAHFFPEEAAVNCLTLLSQDRTPEVSRSAVYALIQAAGE